MEIKHIKKALEGIALQYRTCEGDMPRRWIDCRVRDLTLKYCTSDKMINDMRRYYETLKTGE